MIPRLVIFTLLSSALFAAEPEKLTRLRGSYQSAITKATSPIQKTFLQELEKLKLEYTRAGKLEDALAVAEEIKRLAPLAASNAPRTNGSTKPAADKDALTVEWLTTITITRPNKRIYYFEAPDQVKTHMEAEKISTIGFPFKITGPDTVEFVNAVETLVFTFDRRRNTAAYSSASSGVIDTGSVEKKP